MMAAANGFEACVRELLYAGASRRGRALSPVRPPRVCARPGRGAALSSRPADASRGAGAKPALVCAQGLNAEAWARKRGHVALADLIARGGEDEEESEARAADALRCASRC